jgi:hypothetical protein
MIDLNDDGTFSFRDISAPSRRLVAAHDYDLDAANDWLQDQIREAFDEWSTEPLRAYLGSYGDAVTERVQSPLPKPRACTRLATPVQQRHWPTPALKHRPRPCRPVHPQVR